MGKLVTVVGAVNPASKLELKKHAATIHCSNTLSLLQRKISNALLYHAYHELMEKDEHEISIKQLCKLIVYQGNNHSVIKDALKGLLSTVIEWNVVNDNSGQEDWTASSILASVSLRGPICLYAYSTRMKQLLHSPSMFGKINLFIQSHFKSSYGLALYENCIRYRGLPHTKWLEMDLFRKLMGVPADKYPIFRDFKKRVVDKSIEEVNTYSDLIVVPEIAREGRRAVKIRFSLKERAKKVRLGQKTPNEMLPDENLLLNPLESANLAHTLQELYSLTPEQATKILSHYDEKFILEKVALLNDSLSYQQGKVKNLAAYFISSLKNNYQAPKTKPQKIAANLDIDQQLYLITKKIHQDYLIYREELISSLVEELDDENYAKLLADFQQHAAKPMQTILTLQRKKYTSITVLQSPQIKALFRRFVLGNIPAIAEALLSLAQFIKQQPEKNQHAWYTLKKQAPHLAIFKTTELENSEEIIAD